MASRAIRTSHVYDEVLARHDAEHPEKPLFDEFPAVPSKHGLKGAKGVLVAIGLEAAGAFLLFGIWQVWHLLR